MNTAIAMYLGVVGIYLLVGFVEYRRVTDRSYAWAAILAPSILWGYMVIRWEAPAILGQVLRELRRFASNAALFI